VNPDVSTGLGFSPRASLSSLVATTGLPSLFRTGSPVSGSVRLVPMTGPFLHGLTQGGQQVLRGRERRLVLEHVPEATFGIRTLEHELEATKLGAMRFDRHVGDRLGRSRV
jgi:hypothetical protein